MYCLCLSHRKTTLNIGPAVLNIYFYIYIVFIKPKICISSSEVYNVTVQYSNFVKKKSSVETFRYENTNVHKLLAYLGLQGVSKMTPIYAVLPKFL